MHDLSLATMSARARTACTSTGTDAELDDKIENDNLKIVGALLPGDLRTAIEAAVEKRVAEAIAFAEASTFPEDKEIYDHVFAS